jgi:hypothetical protein
MKYHIVRYTDEQSNIRARCLSAEPMFGQGASIMFRRRADGIWYDSDKFMPLSTTIKASLVMLRLKP